VSEKREIPKCPDRPKSQKTSTTLNYTIKVITPMFGGGCVAGTVDERMPVRGTEIRGNLQFWWRATCGAKYSLEEMLERHQKIWGSTKLKSLVTVSVHAIECVKSESCATYDWDQKAKQGQGGRRLKWKDSFKDVFPYILFPFQGKPPKGKEKKNEQEPAAFFHPFSFQLRIVVREEFCNDVKTAVCAWVNFGGLGARTRRGCGSLYCKEQAPKDQNDIVPCFGKLFHSSSAPQKWPTLLKQFLIGKSSTEALDAWKISVQVLQQFRQGIGFARNSGGKRPGRSRFPEAETIRELVKKRSSQHQRLTNIPCDAFPRAELGLPIIFHFQGEKQDEPPITTLTPLYEGKEQERMASPIILKPLALQDGRAIPMILQLNTPQLSQVILKSEHQQFGPLSETSIRGERLSSYVNSPLAGSSGSALDAFLAFAKKQFHFQEISL
jgi:CRISPR-associated protein Cmr1